MSVTSTTWPVASLARLFDACGGATPDTSNNDFWDGAIPWVSPKDMKRSVISDSEDHVTAKALAETRLPLVPAGRVLVVVRGMILAHSLPVAINSVDVTINQDMKALRPRPDVSAEFLAWLLRGLAGDLLVTVEEAGHGTCCLRMELWKGVRIHLPPIEIQRAIAAFLDRKTAEIDAVIAAKERMMGLLQEQRQALISRAVTGGLGPAVSVKDSGVGWLGPVPSHWTITALKRSARDGYRTFIDGDWIEAPYITDQGIRLIQTGNIGIGCYREQGFRYISHATFDELRCTAVEPDDVLICRLDGPVGRACLAPRLAGPMITSVDVTILKPRPGHDARYLVYLLSLRPYLDWVGSLCRVGGGHRLRVSRSMLGDFRIPFPPPVEQHQLADLLDKQTEGINSIVNRGDEQIAKLREYRQALISAAVTGTIDIAREEGKS